MIYRKIFPTYSLEFQITCVLIEKTKMLLLNGHKGEDQTDIIICTFIFLFSIFWQLWKNYVWVEEETILLIDRGMGVWISPLFVKSTSIYRETELETENLQLVMCTLSIFIIFYSFIYVWKLSYRVTSISFTNGLIYVIAIKQFLSLKDTIKYSCCIRTEFNHEIISTRV